MNKPKPTESSEDTSHSWINDSWKKFQKIVEERKEKSTQQKKEPISVLFDGHGLSSINGDVKDDMDLNSYYYEDETLDATESKTTTPTNEESADGLTLTVTTTKEASPEEVFVEEFVKPSVVLPEQIAETIVETQQPEPSLVAWLVEQYKSFAWSWSRIYYAFSLFMIIPASILSFASPFPSFLNGLLFGVFLSFTSFGVIFVVVLNFIFIKKSDQTKPQQVVATEESGVTLEEEEEEIHKEWMYEYLTDDHTSGGEFESSGRKEKRIRMVYVRLDGTNLRISIPKSDLKRSKLPQNVAKVSFAKQKHYDFSKMSNKKLYFWLPKTVRNKKKYVFAKKYPLIVQFDKCEQNAVKSVKLIFFVFTNRSKEEWFQRFRQALSLPEIVNGDFEKHIDHKLEASSGPPSPRENSHYMDHIRRAQSLSCVTLCTSTSSSSSPSSTTNRKYSQFMNQIINDSTLATEDSSSLLWFNSLIGRVFYDFLTHKHWSNWASNKIQRKLARIKLPYFIQTLKLTSIDLGSSLPRFVGVKNAPKIDNKGLWVDFEVVYAGGLQMTLETKLNLMKLKDQGSLERELKPMKKAATGSLHDFSDSDEDSIVSSSDEEEEAESHSLEDSGKQMLLKFVDKIASSKYFQSATDNKYVKKAMEEVSNTPLVLTVNVIELRGTLCINIPQPPSDRLWYGFRENPHLELSAKPRLGEHQVSLQRVIEWIEQKLKQMFNKILVVPNMDDVALQIMIGSVNESLFVSHVP